MKNYLMLAALGAIFGIGFRFIQQPSSNVNQPSTEPVAETQPVSQDPSQPVSQDPSQPVSQDSSQPVSQDPSQPVSQDSSQPVSQDSSQPVSQDSSQPVSQDPSQPSDSPGFYDPCAHGNQCRNDPPTIEKQLEKVGDKLNPSNPDSAPRELGRKLDPTSW
ncbi:MAG: hypothetical protein KME25_33470 [Symplocastrum torsivum CPER-KK1]|uniref:Uncharacterized protein n=1 Tax=Symplocastrum torsivum CPER-KK1 TaxID=450513 RepID=A0A951PU77_9CYAN|nr:hypothetical protein [Symplocastrum torsivum CPER-KK1]